MLPFMQPKRVASMIIQKRSEDGAVKSQAPEAEHAPELVEHANNLISAVHAKDTNKTIDALTAFHKQLAKSTDSPAAPDEN